MRLSRRVPAALPLEARQRGSLTGEPTGWVSVGARSWGPVAARCVIWRAPLCLNVSKLSVALFCRGLAGCACGAQVLAQVGEEAKGAAAQRLAQAAAAGRGGKALARELTAWSRPLVAACLLRTECSVACFAALAPEGEGAAGGLDDLSAEDQGGGAPPQRLPRRQVAATEPDEVARPVAVRGSKTMRRGG